MDHVGRNEVTPSGECARLHPIHIAQIDDDASRVGPVHNSVHLSDNPCGVLDHGFVRVVDYMGNDSSVVQAARVSYGAGTKKVNADKGLIHYLISHRHTTPQRAQQWLACKAPCRGHPRDCPAAYTGRDNPTPPVWPGVSAYLVRPPWNARKAKRDSSWPWLA